MWCKYICVHCDHVVIQGLTLEGLDSELEYLQGGLFIDKDISKIFIYFLFFPEVQPKYLS